ncbi:phage collar protein [Xenorhabdus japonica]|uniref:Uncharacterized protein n=1 Tax=Xenorhabdus japonica TaxID=53341 RepID=A0A1I5DGM3_9GAMM|nr:hypothetical protein [Xenorhabdus japonica]SFN98257.1 hypothetical protein SAMN05421579_14017 [Xenorhabdus japonica]
MFGHLHRMASRYIPQQTALWYRFKTREEDELGQWQSVYHEPLPISGSWQAVDTQDVQEMGLDTAKVYRKLYTSHDISHIQRGAAPDYLVFAGRRYEVTGDADWYAQDGWKSVICIEAGSHDG